MTHSTLFYQGKGTAAYPSFSSFKNESYQLTGGRPTVLPRYPIGYASRPMTANETHYTNDPPNFRSLRRRVSVLETLLSLD